EPVSWRYTRPRPSGEKTGLELAGESTSRVFWSDTGSPDQIRPCSSTNAIDPLRATPNGAGTDGREPASGANPPREARGREASPATRRRGVMTAEAGRIARSMGSHDSRKLHAGRCRVRAVRARSWV